MHTCTWTPRSRKRTVPLIWSVDTVCVTVAQLFRTQTEAFRGTQLDVPYYISERCRRQWHWCVTVTTEPVAGAIAECFARVASESHLFANKSMFWSGALSEGCANVCMLFEAISCQAGALPDKRQYRNGHHTKCHEEQEKPRRQEYDASMPFVKWWRRIEMCLSQLFISVTNAIRVSIRCYCRCVGGGRHISGRGRRRISPVVLKQLIQYKNNNINKAVLYISITHKANRYLKIYKQLTIMFESLHHKCLSSDPLSVLHVAFYAIWSLGG